MMDNKIPDGAWPAFITPFTKDGKIIIDTVKALIDYHIENGLDAFYIGGSTGEGMIMTPDQRMELAEAVTGYVNGRVPVIIHVGCADTATAVNLAEHAKKCGADGVSSVPPYYYRMSRSYIKEYYKAVAAAADLPLLVYNIPMLTGVSIGADFMFEIMEIENIIGLKFTDTNLEEFRKIKDYQGGRIKAYIGFDQMLLCALFMGGNGGIGTWYNLMPKAFSGVYDHYVAGRYEEARGLQWKIDHYIAIMKRYACPAIQAVVKPILREMGFDAGTVLPPLQPLSSLNERSLIDELRGEGFFEFVK